MNDGTKLDSKRAKLLRELVELDAEIKETEYLISCHEEDATLYLKERGGDTDLVRIHESQLAKLGTKTDTVNEELERLLSKHKQAASGDSRVGISEAQMIRRAQRGVGSSTDEMVQDAVVFSNARKCLPAEISDSGSNLSEQAFLFKWSKLPQDDDKLVKLDVDLVEDLFEAGGILLSDVEAQHCLDAIPTNQLGKHSFEDVINWYKEYARTELIAVPQFRQVARNCGQYFRKQRMMFQKIMEKLKTQHMLVADVKEYRRKLLVREKNNEKGDSSLEHDELSESSPSPPPSRSGVNGAAVLTFKGIESSLHGAARLAAWQRQQVLGPAAKIDFRATFGIRGTTRTFSTTLQKNPHRSKSNQNTGRKSTPHTSRTHHHTHHSHTQQHGHGHSTSRSHHAHVDVKPKEDPKVPPKYKMSIGLKYSLKPLMDGRNAPLPTNQGKKFYNVDTMEIKDIFAITPTDLLDNYGYTETGLLGSLSKTFGSVCWISFQVGDHVTFEESQCLLLCCRNFFESIPYEERKFLYTHVEGELFHLPMPPVEPHHVTGTNTARTTMDTPMGTARVHVAPLHPPRLILISLLHEEDLFRSTEEHIAPGLLVSRSVREARCEINLVQSIADLYKASFPFEHFEDRLFGPQEDELGEEGMNPLRYAKMCKSRQNAAKAAINQAQNMTLEELRDHCYQRGLSDTGTKATLAARVKRAFQRQLDIIGFGELSAFGESICSRIFSMFKNEENFDDGLTLWEINDMLFKTGSTKCLYDDKEYKIIVDEQELRADRRSRILTDGMTAYYETFGRLGEDMRKLGLGSLDDFMTGKFSFSCEFDPPGFSSLLNLLSDETIAEPVLKRVLKLLSSLYTWSTEVDYMSIRNLLEALQKLLLSSGLVTGTTWEKFLLDILDKLLEIVTKPGWFAGNIHSILEVLANGEDGWVRSLRLYLMQEYTSFDNWEQVFREQYAAWKHHQVVRARSMSSGSSSSSSSSGSDESGSKGRLSKKSESKAEGEAEEGEIEVGEGSESSRSKSSAAHSSAPSSPVSPTATGTFASALFDEDLSEDDDDVVEEEDEEEEEAEWIQFQRFFQRALPEIVDSRQYSNESYNTLRDQVKRIVALLAREDIHLTRLERDMSKQAKEKLEREMNEIRVKQEEAKKLCAAHACAFYDAFRLYGVGIYSVGFGTREVNLQLTTHGCEWSNFLPRAYGELCIPLHVREEKLRRAAQRKNAALAALEREHQRRHMDDEEKRAHDKETNHKREKKMEEEENQLFVEAYDAWCLAREPQPAVVIAEMVELWEQLSILKTARYPRTMHAVVCQNNFSSVCLQFYPSSHVRWSDALVSLEACSDTLMSILEEFSLKHAAFVQRSIDNDHVATEKERLDEDTFEVVDKKAHSEEAPAVVSVDHNDGSHPQAILEEHEHPHHGHAHHGKHHHHHHNYHENRHVPSTAIVPPALVLHPHAHQHHSHHPPHHHHGHAHGHHHRHPSISDSPHTPATEVTSREVSADTTRINTANTTSQTTAFNTFRPEHEEVPLTAAEALVRFPRTVEGIPDALISPGVIILQNYVNMIRRTHPSYFVSMDKVEVLSERTGSERSEVPQPATLPTIEPELDFNQKRQLQAKLFVIASLFSKLTAAEQDRVLVGACRSVHHIPVLFFGDMKVEIPKTVDLVKDLLAKEQADQVEKDLLEEERQKQEEIDRKLAQDEFTRLEEAHRKEEEERLAEEEILDENDPVQIRKALELKHKKQRELDKIKRIRISRQRNKLYSMIRTDEITTMFYAAASDGAVTADNLTWGQAETAMESQQAFFENAPPITLESSSRKNRLPTEAITGAESDTVHTIAASENTASSSLAKFKPEKSQVATAKLLKEPKTYFKERRVLAPEKLVAEPADENRKSHKRSVLSWVSSSLSSRG